MVFVNMRGDKFYIYISEVIKLQYWIFVTLKTKLYHLSSTYTELVLISFFVLKGNQVHTLYFSVYRFFHLSLFFTCLIVYRSISYYKEFSPWMIFVFFELSQLPYMFHVWHYLHLSYGVFWLVGVTNGLCCNGETIQEERLHFPRIFSIKGTFMKYFMSWYVGVCCCDFIDKCW